MLHVPTVCPPECETPYCNICQGGLFLCSVCGLYEGGLTSECPGENSCDKADDVYRGKIDFRNGAWVEAVSKHSPESRWSEEEDGGQHG